MAEVSLLSGETKNIEYKVTIPNKSEKYMKTLIAFANTQGGKLIIGVGDKTHEVAGVDNSELFQMMDSIANAVSDSCVPQIIPDIEPQTMDGKTVLSWLLWDRTLVISITKPLSTLYAGHKAVLQCSWST